MGKAEDRYIWGMKRVLGSNALISDVEDQKKKNLLRPSLELSNKRAQFNIHFGNVDLVLDSELIVVFVLEYICFLCQKGQNDTYENLSTVAADFVANHNQLCISVGVFQHRLTALGPGVFYSFQQSRF